MSEYDIYYWYVNRNARTVIINATHDHGMLKSRARTVYFSAVSCPPGLFDPDGEPFREIYFDIGEKPCFVQHHFYKLNRNTGRRNRTRACCCPTACGLFTWRYRTTRLSL
ncbi:hypothetical protein Plhal304r1_c007g0027521 [Plasmopara halstedii]